MALFYKSKYIEGHLLEDNIVVLQYLLANDYLDIESYKDGALNVAQKVNAIGAKLLLIDKVYTDFVFTDELQEWVVNIMAPLCISLRKIAFLTAKDVFAQLSTEQVMHEITEKTTLKHTRYFQNYDEAIDWLREK